MSLDNKTKLVHKARKIAETFWRDFSLGFNSERLDLNWNPKKSTRVPFGVFYIQ